MLFGLKSDKSMVDFFEDVLFISRDTTGSDFKLNCEGVFICTVG